MFESKVLPTVAVCILGACLGGAARADTTNGYGVATSAAAGDFFAFLGTVSAYRMMGDSSGNYTIPSDTPPVQIDPCPFVINPNTYCVATLAGTNSANYNLTASSSAAALQTGQVNDLPDTLGQVSGVTYADLASGKLGGSTQADYGRTASTNAVFNDRLTFNIPGAGPTTVTNIAVSFSIDGGLVNSGNAFSGASVSADLRFGAAFASVAYQRANGDTISPPFSILNQGGWVSGSWAPGFSPSLSIFNGVYALVGATPTLDVRGALDTFANSVASATYSNTAAFQMSLPAGVSYSSASGVFLSAVPEPGSWALMLAGVGGLLTLARRRAA